MQRMANTAPGQVQGAHARWPSRGVGSGKDPGWRRRSEEDISSRTNDRDKQVEWAWYFPVIKLVQQGWRIEHEEQQEWRQGEL